ncbi:MAG: GTP-binding protein [Candidatus Brocadiia bacterium]
MNPKTPQAALLTPLGEGGIGIIALCGGGATDVLDEVFAGTRRSVRDIRIGMVAHGTVRRGGEVLDEVIVARVASPQAGCESPCYEVNCHGGVAAVQAVMDRLVEAGARRGEWSPGGEAPLSREGIRQTAMAALPHAPTRLSVLMLLHQSQGALADEIARLSDLLDAGNVEMGRRCIERLLATASLGHALLEPPRVALLGPPNAGKSTLFNALFEEERVIVDEEPGTTRDVVAEVVSVRGVPFRILDAAGIGAPADELERRAVERARGLGRDCDVALAVFDVRDGADYALLPPLRSGARLITVLNKIDLVREPGLAGEAADGPVVRISAKEHTNIDQLEEALLQPYKGLFRRCREGGAVIFDERQREALRRVGEVLEAEGAEGAVRTLTDLTEPGPSL